MSDEEYIGADEVEDYRARGRKVIELEEENYFFRLSRFQDRLLQWYEDHPDVIHPVGRRNEVLGLIKGGLLDFSISRTSLEWGVPIPWDERHVTYVWFDALTNYITAAGYGQPDEAAEFAKWWPAVHLIGKDIIRFHCVYWPAMLLSAGVEPPRDWHVHGWLLVGGEKMSKTALNQIAPADLVADFGLDPYRYHFLADCPVGADNDFSYEGMVARYNADLANNLGNLLSRVATVVGSKCGGVGPAPSDSSPLLEAAAIAAADASAGWYAVQPSEALAATWQLIRATNAYLEANEPWKAEPGPGVDAGAGRRARGAAHRGAAGVTGHPGHGPDDLGADRAVRRTRRPAGARRAGLGRLPRRADGDEGPAALPSPDGLTKETGPWAGSTTTATSTTTGSRAALPVRWPPPGRPVSPAS